jgi:hypothetical protein
MAGASFSASSKRQMPRPPKLPRCVSSSLTTTSAAASSSASTYKKAPIPLAMVVNQRKSRQLRRLSLHSWSERFRRSSAAVATSQEDHRTRRLGRGALHRRPIATSQEGHRTPRSERAVAAILSARHRVPKVSTFLDFLVECFDLARGPALKTFHLPRLNGGPIWSPCALTRGNLRVCGGSNFSSFDRQAPDHRTVQS